jgi:hypothetical protein
MIPSDDKTFTNEDILEIINEEIAVFGIQHLMSTHEEYLLTYEDKTIVSGQAAYAIPERAIGNKLRDVQYIDSSNNVFELSRISVDDLSDYNDSSALERPQIFYIQDNKIVLVDGLPQDGSLRMYFYLRPNDLVEDKYAATITDINRTTGVITVSNFQSDFSTLPELDFVQVKSPNKILDYDITPTAVDSNTSSITFSLTDIPADLIVGDYLMLQHEAIVPQLPVELHPIISQRAAVHCLEAMGDAQGLQVAQARLQMMEKATLDLIDNRVEAAQQKIVNRHGTLRQATLGDPARRTKLL